MSGKPVRLGTLNRTRRNTDALVVATFDNNRTNEAGYTRIPLDDGTAAHGRLGGTPGERGEVERRRQRPGGSCR